MGKGCGVELIRIDGQFCKVWNRLDLRLGLRKVLEDLCMRLERAIRADQAEEALMPLVLAGRSIPELISIIGKAPDDRTGRAAVMQFRQGQAEELGQILFAGHELL